MVSRSVPKAAQKEAQQHPRRRMYHRGRRWWFRGLILCAFGVFFSTMRSGPRTQITTGTSTYAAAEKLLDDHGTQQRPEKDLVVHLIPHSHVDPGWLHSIDEYYDERVRHILANTVRQLVLNRRRTRPAHPLPSRL